MIAKKCNLCESKDHETIVCPSMGNRDYLAQSIDRMAGDKEAMRQVIHSLRSDFRMNVTLRRELETRVERLENLYQNSISNFLQ